jgi:hypothetical protein
MVRSVAQVIEVLGDGDKQAGRRELMRITGRKTQHVTNWLAVGNLPQWSWLIVSRAIRRRGHGITPELFGLPNKQVKSA